VCIVYVGSFGFEFHRVDPVSKISVNSFEVVNRIQAAVAAYPQADSFVFTYFFRRRLDGRKYLISRLEKGLMKYLIVMSM